MLRSFVLLSVLSHVTLGGPGNNSHSWAYTNYEWEITRSTTIYDYFTTIRINKLEVDMNYEPCLYPKFTIKIAPTNFLSGSNWIKIHINGQVADTVCNPGASTGCLPTYTCLDEWYLGSDIPAYSSFYVTFFPSNENIYPYSGCSSVSFVAEITLTCQQVPTQSPTLKPTYSPTAVNVHQWWPYNGQYGSVNNEVIQDSGQTMIANKLYAFVQGWACYNPILYIDIAPTDFDSASEFIDSIYINGVLATTDCNPGSASSCDPTYNCVSLYNANYGSILWQIEILFVPSYISAAGMNTLQGCNDYSFVANVTLKCGSSADPWKFVPSAYPTNTPTRKPTDQPTKRPSKQPTRTPTKNPVRQPTKSPTKNPTRTPIPDPTNNPTKNPTKYPSEYPTKSPVAEPSEGVNRGGDDSSNSSASLGKYSDSLLIVAPVMVFFLAMLCIFCIYRKKKTNAMKVYRQNSRNLAVQQQMPNTQMSNIPQYNYNQQNYSNNQYPSYNMQEGNMYQNNSNTPGNTYY